MTSFNTPKFDAAVLAFKALCDPLKQFVPGSKNYSHHQLFEYGQFYVTTRTVDDLKGQIETELRSNIRLKFLGEAELNKTVELFKKKLSGSVSSMSATSILALLDLIEVNGDMAAIRELFKPQPSDRAHAQADFNAVWSSRDIPAAPAYTGSAPTLSKAQAAYTLEKSKCWTVLRAFAAMLLRAKGVPILKSSEVVSEGAVGRAFVHDTEPGSPAQTPRQTLRYPDAPALAGAVQRMKAAIDAGGFVHCGVLSGAQHEHSRFPQPEHHVLVFAYDTIDGQDAFLFWDPDAGHSVIASTTWGAGFGVLFAKLVAAPSPLSRLSTAIDDADLVAIDRAALSVSFGDHTRETLRHCYQVYFMQTLPLPKTVKLHAKLLAPDGRTGFDDMLYNATVLLAAHGVELIEASRETFETQGGGLERFQTLFVGESALGAASADVTDLHETLRAQAIESGTALAAEEIVVAQVQQLVPAARSCSAHPLEKPGLALAAASAGPWTLAHALGHVLGLDHVADVAQLMFATTDAIADETPQLDAAAVATMFASPLTQG